MTQPSRLLSAVITATLALSAMPSAANAALPPASSAMTSPVSCPALPAFDSADWRQIERAFSSAPVWKFDQSWREKRERGFRGGRVRIGWRGDRLLYFADLSDREVTTRARQRNDPMWTMGDVLEIFAGGRGRPSYIEYHTAPNGLVLQLFWPDAGALQRMGGLEGLKSFIKKDDSSVALVRRVRRGWQVYGEIPSASVLGSKPRKATLEGQVWDLSFGRYDYPAGDGTPVHSSTSPRTKAAFHRRHEWRQVRFVP